MTQDFLEYDRIYLKEMEVFVSSIYDGIWMANQGRGGSIRFETTERTIVFLPHNLSLYRWRDITPNKEPLDVRRILLLEALKNNEVSNKIIPLLAERMGVQFMREALSHIASSLDEKEVAEILKYAISYTSQKGGESLALAAIIKSSDPIEQEDD